MKIVILGGSGYLASCLSYYLKKKNKITLVSTKPDKINYRLRNVKIKKANYLKLNSLIKIFKNQDYILHLVGANKHDSSKYKKKNFNLKINTTKKIIKAANFSKTKIIYFSSAQVYKDINKEKATINELSKVFKSNQYTANHIEAENLILEDIKKNKSEHKIIRLSSVFGMPFFNFNKEAFNLIINSLCLQAYQEKKITIGDPSIFRDFIPSKVFNDFEKYFFNKKKLNIINLGFKTYSLIEIAKLIKKICERKFKFSPYIDIKSVSSFRNKSYFKSKYYKFNKNTEIIHYEINNLLNLIKRNV